MPCILLVSFYWIENHALPNKNAILAVYKILDADSYLTLSPMYMHDIAESSLYRFRIQFVIVALFN